MIENLARNWTTRPRVLTVEDDPNDRELVAYALNDLGCDHEETNSAEKAIEIIKAKILVSEDPTRPYDIIFVDLKLPGSSGISVIKFCTENIPCVPIGIVSGYLDQVSLNEISRTGYIGIIQKPLDQVNIKTILEKHKIPLPPINGQAV